MFERPCPEAARHRRALRARQHARHRGHRCARLRAQSAPSAPPRRQPRWLERFQSRRRRSRCEPVANRFQNDDRSIGADRCSKVLQERVDRIEETARRTVNGEAAVMQAVVPYLRSRSATLNRGKGRTFLRRCSATRWHCLATMQRMGEESGNFLDFNSVFGGQQFRGSRRRAGPL